MPYIKSNWESNPPLDDFGRFKFGEILTIPDLRLSNCKITPLYTGEQNHDAMSQTACYIHFVNEHPARLTDMSILCNASSISVSVMKNDDKNNMKSMQGLIYNYVTTIKGEPSEAYENMWQFRLNKSHLADLKIWQIQLKFLFREYSISELRIEKISVKMEDIHRDRGVNMDIELVQDRRDVLSHVESKDLMAYNNSHNFNKFNTNNSMNPADGFMQHVNPNLSSTENAVAVGLMVVDKLLGVMTDEIQENLNQTCQDIEDRLFEDLTVLEEKMNRMENHFRKTRLDKRLQNLENYVTDISDRQSGKKSEIKEEKIQRVVYNKDDDVSRKKRSLSRNASMGNISNSNRSSLGRSRNSAMSKSFSGKVTYMATDETNVMNDDIFTADVLFNTDKENTITTNTTTTTSTMNKNSNWSKNVNHLESNTTPLSSSKLTNDNNIQTEKVKREKSKMKLSSFFKGFK